MARHSLSLCVTSNTSAALALLTSAELAENFGNTPMTKAAAPSPPLATRNCRRENMVVSENSRCLAWNTA
jgi:hypothetical protein